MASTFLKSLSIYHISPIQISTPNIPKPQKIPPKRHLLSTKCTTNNSSPQSQPQPIINADSDSDSDSDSESYPNSSSSALNSTETFPIEKRRKSEIQRERKLKQEMTKGDPPSFEIGWKRSKKIVVEKPKGYVIMDFLGKLEELMGKEYGSTALLEKVGEIVAERAREEAEMLKEEGKVEERMVTELFRVLKLMEMDLAMVKASVKQDTLDERLEVAKARCRQAILVANSF